MSTKTHNIHVTKASHSIAYVKRYHHRSKKRPGILFLGGFRSDMNGTKATFLENWCFEQKHNFLKFDYSGHGCSSGLFESGCISDWLNDACEVLDHLTHGPQILVGSSMGGWISLLLGKSRPERVHALVGIAAAPDFTENSMWANLDKKNRNDLAMFGKVEVKSKYSSEPYLVTERLIIDGRCNLVMKDPLEASYSIRLLQGMRDEDVHFSTAIKLAEHINSDDVKVALVKNADHQFSTRACLEILKMTIEEFL